MSSKSPLKDYSRLLGIDRTIKKQQTNYRLSKYDTSDRIVDQLRAKLDLSLKHNAKLLDENSELSELASKLRTEIKLLNEKVGLLGTAEADGAKRVEMERLALERELQVKQFAHEGELRKLLDEVSRLHQEKNDLEIIKNKELLAYRNEHEKNLQGCIQSLRSTHQNSKDLYETQINKMKQTISNQERQINSLKAEHKLLANRLQQKINNLEAQTAHLHKLHKLQLQEVQNTLGMELHRERRAMQHEREVESSTHGLAMKKIKNQLLEKNLEIEAINKRMATNENMHSIDLQNLKREKQMLLSEVATAQVTHANILTREKSKLRQINEQEIKNILDMNETHIEELRNEINHLRNLLDCKSNEIRRLFEENSNMKKSYEAELTLQTRTNQELRIRLKALEKENLQSLQAFKIKIAQLVDADMKSLVSYYQNELSLLQANVNALEDINKDNKDKLYKALQDNDELRKNFEVQISKQKARVQDLKIKIASLNLQHKQHAQSLASRMELTSQTLIREADQKNKSQAFFEEEKRKFYSLSNAKDKQIADLLDTMHKMKKMHETELNILRSEKKELREEIQVNEEKIIELKKKHDEELSTIKIRLINEEKPEQNREKQLLKQLYEKNEKVENENIRLQKQVEHMVRENRALAGELGLKKGYIETLHLQSSAAIEDEKGKLRQMMGNSEMSLKEYFEDKLASRQKDIDHLKTVLAGKQQDIRDLIVKYNGLEKRLQTLLASQEKLRDLDEKVKSLGLDNNLVKNMTQIFNRPQVRLAN